ncbi:pyrroline-5-carboxylate reductase [Caballeronia sp. LZ043]|uniref:pyrroline-5-carboxylate reductase n=1 Tax=Caballeronia sp. LZ043 TaxID=3038569 RepID=UPI002866F2F9|nr:pyrroline-5-carboxylate reductase [Caballeronia sp. LZ043]MDR5825859.1 pyrroline-5-carboxylate reductase [Caballeronia sp. LZ043]
MKIAFIGAGNLASALMGGLIRRGATPHDLLAVDPDESKRQAAAQELGVATAERLASAEGVDAVVLAVKPQILEKVCAALAPLLKRQLVISVAAGVRIADISRWLGGYAAIVRSMPNTPALIGMGMTGLHAAPDVTPDMREQANAVMSSVGATLWVEHEAQLDAVTAVSGSGPAYVFYFIESLIAAGESAGLDAGQARTLALETFFGASALARQSDETAAVLRERVTSKGGTTAAALASFEQSGIKEEIGRGVRAAQARSDELARELGAQ